MSEPNPPISERRSLPLLPLRGAVLYPGVTMRIDVGRPRSTALLKAIEEGDEIAVGVQLDPNIADPMRAHLADQVTIGRVVAIRARSERTFQVTLEGVSRATLLDLDGVEPFYRAALQPIVEHADDEAVALALALRSALAEWGTLKDAPSDVVENLPSAEEVERDPGMFADRIAAALPLDLTEQIDLLRLYHPADRLRRVVAHVAEARERIELRQQIDKDVRQQLGKTQKEAILREQLRAIKKQLGDKNEDPQDELRGRLSEKQLPEEVQKVVDRELDRLETVGQGPEANIIRTYLDWIANLPWSERAEASDDLEGIAAHLDADHEGLEDVKKRILEHMAVQSLSGNSRGSILCLVGPPGVGKTSLGASIAEATGRPFVRVALGGVRDEAEVRGHRRTYVGALPGRIIAALKKAKVKNPVLLLDEVDKLSQGWSGNPEAALLEVLDPEQNDTFTDHYLELPFDLSEVMFLCTANQLDAISGPLRDRLEIVELSGYTQREKLNIAKNHLVPKRIEDHGLRAEEIEFSDEALETIIEGYTREAGVRQLSREIARLCRHVALDVARTRRRTSSSSDVAESTPELTAETVADVLGKPKFQRDVAELTALPGVATGLAWTPVGGDILFIETSRMPGKGRVEITGQLGDVMKESARAALTYVRSHADELAIDTSSLESEDLHIHVPAGAVPKDGPSAGVTMFTALASLLTGRKVRPDTAMTGECTLRGRVLPVGGIKAKVLAAHRAGLKRVILPQKNERDLDDVPTDVRQDLEIVFAADMADVLAAALTVDDGVSAPASVTDASLADLASPSI